MDPERLANYPKPVEVHWRDELAEAIDQTGGPVLFYVFWLPSIIFTLVEAVLVTISFLHGLLANPGNS